MEDTSLTNIKQDLTDLFACLQQVQYEIAAMLRPSDSDHNLVRTGDHLRAIVEATESSANTIMEAMERNEELVGQLRELATIPEQSALLDAISVNSMSVFEACTFQDIAGQRITKAIAAITYMETRLNKLIEIWGRDSLAEIEVDGIRKTDDQKLMNGPQLQGEGVNQTDIDALFGFAPAPTKSAV